MLKNKDTGEVYFVIVFALIPRDQVDKQGEGASMESSKGSLRGGEATGEKRTRSDGGGQEEFQPKADDLD